MKKKVLSKSRGKTLKLCTTQSKKRWKKLSNSEERTIQIMVDILTSGRPLYHIPRFVQYNPPYYIDTFIK